MQALVQELLARYGGWIGTVLFGLAVYYFLALSWDDDGKGDRDGRGD